MADWMKKLGSLVGWSGEGPGDRGFAGRSGGQPNSQPDPHANGVQTTVNAGGPLPYRTAGMPGSSRKWTDEQIDGDIVKRIKPLKEKEREEERKGHLEAMGHPVTFDQDLHDAMNPHGV